MKVDVCDLILEVTRQCNMTCAHCLRGCAQNMVITKEIIDKLLDNIDYIQTVIFTGGEPSLHYEMIDCFFEAALKRDKMPTSFWLATNGKANQMELAQVLLKWYPYMSKKDCCGVALSIDNFHEDVGNRYPSALMRDFSFYDSSKEHKLDINDDKWVIRTGSAAENGYGHKPYLPQHTQLYIDEYDMVENILTIENLYVSANGNIIGDCDFDYDTIDEEYVTTVNELAQHLESIAAKLKEEILKEEIA